MTQQLLACGKNSLANRNSLVCCKINLLRERNALGSLTKLVVKPYGSKCSAVAPLLVSVNLNGYLGHTLAGNLRLAKGCAGKEHHAKRLYVIFIYVAVNL